MGKIVCKNAAAEKIELYSGVGDITAENCSANGTLTIDGDVCNVQMKDLDGGKISVNTNLEIFLCRALFPPRRRK